jgi:hypothetical protein
LALLCAVLFFIFWIFRLAFLANYLLRAVMAGFITGLGVEVFTNQVRKILAAPHVEIATSGVLAAAEHLKETLASSVNTEGYFVEALALFHSIPRANLYSETPLSPFVRDSESSGPGVYCAVGRPPPPKGGPWGTADPGGLRNSVPA